MGSFPAFLATLVSCVLIGPYRVATDTPIHFFSTNCSSSAADMTIINIYCKTTAETFISTARESGYL